MEKTFITESQKLKAAQSEQQSNNKQQWSEIIVSTILKQAIQNVLNNEIELKKIIMPKIAANTIDLFSNSEHSGLIDYCSLIEMNKQSSLEEDKTPPYKGIIVKKEKNNEALENMNKKKSIVKMSSQSKKFSLKRNSKIRKNSFKKEKQSVNIYEIKLPSKEKYLNKLPSIFVENQQRTQRPTQIKQKISGEKLLPPLTSKRSHQRENQKVFVLLNCNTHQSQNVNNFIPNSQTQKHIELLRNYKTDKAKLNPILNPSQRNKMNKHKASIKKEHKTHKPPPQQTKTFDSYIKVLTQPTNSKKIEQKSIPLQNKHNDNGRNKLLSKNNSDKNQNEKYQNVIDAQHQKLEMSKRCVITKSKMDQKENQ